MSSITVQIGFGEKRELGTADADRVDEVGSFFYLDSNLKKKLFCLACS